MTTPSKIELLDSILNIDEMFQINVHSILNDNNPNLELTRGGMVKFDHPFLSYAVLDPSIINKESNLNEDPPRAIIIIGDNLNEMITIFKFCSLGIDRFSQYYELVIMIHFHETETNASKINSKVSEEFKRLSNKYKVS
jgi:hypothetical protein